MIRDVNNPSRTRTQRFAFTLVELMTVMALMVILTAMGASMLASAQQTARVTRAQRQLETISQILQSEMNQLVLAPIRYQDSSPTSTAFREVARAQLMARRDQLRMAFPDRRADLLHPPTRIVFGSNGDPTTDPTVFDAVKIMPPASWKRMRRELNMLTPTSLPDENTDIGEGAVSLGGSLENFAFIMDGDTGDWVHVDAPVDTSVPIEDRYRYRWTRQYESAECLYLILSSITYNDTPAIELIGSRQVANVDGDAVSEIVDPWGVPVEFIRWPIGFDSSIIHEAAPDDLDFGRADWRFRDGNWSETDSNLDNNPISLPPLIISAGADGVFDLRLSTSQNANFSYATMTWPKGSTNYGSSSFGTYRYPDPYFNVAGGNNDFIAARNGGGFGARVDTDSDGSVSGADDNISSILP